MCLIMSSKDPLFCLQQQQQQLHSTQYALQTQQNTVQIQSKSLKVKVGNLTQCGELNMLLLDGLCEIKII